MPCHTVCSQPFEELAGFVVMATKVTSLVANGFHWSVLQSTGGNTPKSPFTLLRRVWANFFLTQILSLPPQPPSVWHKSLKADVMEKTANPTSLFPVELVFIYSILLIATPLAAMKGVLIRGKYSSMEHLVLQRLLYPPCSLHPLSLFSSNYLSSSLHCMLNFHAPRHQNSLISTRLMKRPLVH